MKRGKLLFTIGPARCGKSTYCNQWVKFFGEKVDFSSPDISPRTIICSDDIRVALHGNRYNRHAEPVTFGYKQIAIEAALRRGSDVIVDGTHTTETSIRRILEIEPTAGYLIFDTPLDVCLQRAIDTDQKDLLPVISRHYKQMEELIGKGIDNTIEKILNDIKDRWVK